jgi:hypothetical protein
MKGSVMSKIHTIAPAQPPMFPIAVSVDGVTAGLALRDKHRFRFFSSHSRFDLLDGSRFSRLEDVRWAVARLARASAEAGAAQGAPSERLQDVAA